MDDILIDLFLIQLGMKLKAQRKAASIPQEPANDNKRLPGWLNTVGIFSWTFLLVYSIIWVLR